MPGFGDYSTVYACILADLSMGVVRIGPLQLSMKLVMCYFPNRLCCYRAELWLVLSSTGVQRDVFETIGAFHFGLQLSTVVVLPKHT